jgi:hypothetical protein
MATYSRRSHLQGSPSPTLPGAVPSTCCPPECSLTPPTTRKRLGRTCSVSRTRPLTHSERRETPRGECRVNVVAGVPRLRGGGVPGGPADDRMGQEVSRRLRRLHGGFPLHFACQCVIGTEKCGQDSWEWFPRFAAIGGRTPGVGCCSIVRSASLTVEVLVPQHFAPASPHDRNADGSKLWRSGRIRWR